MLTNEADNEMKLTQNAAYQPVVKSSTEEPMYSDLHDYSGIVYNSSDLLKLFFHNP